AGDGGLRTAPARTRGRRHGRGARRARRAPRDASLRHDPRARLRTDHRGGHAVGDPARRSGTRRLSRHESKLVSTNGATADDAIPKDTASDDNLLELRGVRAAYERIDVLYGIDLAVPRGSVVALLGPNGAGKTTTLRVASGLHQPTSGDVMVAGRRVN